MTKAVDNITDQNGIDHVAAVVPSDTNELPNVARSLYITGAGNLKFIARGDAVAVTMAVTAGQTLNIRIRQVFATGTTATGILAEY
jgi:hypothetical protein